MMKKLILPFFVLAFLLMVAENQQTTIQVFIVLPPALMPYYDWLLNFPGGQPMQDEPHTPQPMGIGYRLVTSFTKTLHSCHPPVTRKL